MHRDGYASYATLAADEALVAGDATTQGELDEFRKHVAFLLDQGWIVPPWCASHAASVVFARKPNGTWRFCQDYRELNAITQRSVEPLSHVD